MPVHALGTGASAGFRRHGAPVVGALLAITVVGGGSSHGTGTAAALAQVVALPVLGWAALALAAGGSPGKRPVTLPLLVVGAIVLLLAASQLPIPASLWESPLARDALAADLDAVGVVVSPHWALSPLAGERALWFLLPGLAVFVGALCVEPAHLRALLLLVVALGAASLLLGALQMAVPRDSPLNLYPRWAPAFNGVFENPNHQASLLALSATIVAALPWRAHGGGRFRRSAPAWILLGAMAALAIPLTGSRAGMGLAALGVCAAIGLRWLHARALRARSGARLPAAPQAPVRRHGLARRLATAGAPRPWGPVVAGIAIAGLAALAVLAWPRLGGDGSVRWSLVEATAAMAGEHAPLGAGPGMFPTWFDQSAPAALVQWEFFHHAHNEYVQWWFEFGIAGVACATAVLAMVAWRSPRAGRDAGAATGFGVPLAAWLGCVLLLLHSIVDYVLRTPAMMAVGALMAGVLVASHARSRHPPATTAKEPR